MKRTLLFSLTLLCAAIVFALAAKSAPPQSDAFARGFRAQGFSALIDAGHGGFDSGARRQGVDEAPLNLSVARKLRQALQKRGVASDMTRAGSGALAQTKQEDMRVRSEAASSEKYDIVISIHQNAFTNKRACGTAVYYKPGCEKSKEAARLVKEALAAALPKTSHRETAPGNFLILKSASAPAIMLECGFMSNPQELSRLMDEEYQQTIALCVAEAVAGVLQSQKKRVAPESFQPQRAKRAEKAQISSSPSR